MRFGVVPKAMFFDAKRVKRAVDSATRRVLSKFGAYVRTAARSSIRKRKRISRPGEPPSSHTGLLKKFIFFGYEPGRGGVVIGPARLDAKIGDAPAALEHGGRSQVTVGGRRKKTKKGVKTVTIRARPYMGPALAKEQPKLPAMWRDSVT